MGERIVRRGDAHVRLGAEGSPESGFQEVALGSGGDPVQGRFWAATGATAGMIWVGGVGGGWDTPAAHLYPMLSHELTKSRIASLRVRFRYSGDLEECTRDVLAGVEFLEKKGIKAVGLAGWSFGGAVVMQAGARSELVRTVITFATQSYGAEAVSRLPQECSVLLLHGTLDSVLPCWCSIQVHGQAHEPKELILLEGAEHGLEETADEAHEIVRKWILERLGQGT